MLRSTKARFGGFIACCLLKSLPHGINLDDDYPEVIFVLRICTNKLGSIPANAITLPKLVEQLQTSSFRLSALGCQCRDALWPAPAASTARALRVQRDHRAPGRLSPLYGLCWTGTERPSKLFERATAWLLAHKILLPGCTLVVRLRSRVEAKVWRLLGRGITGEQRKRLESNGA